MLPAKRSLPRANPNIASVEMTDHASWQDDKGERTAAAKAGRDFDGDGKRVFPRSTLVVHNAIQKRMALDGKDTRGRV